MAELAQLYLLTNDLFCGTDKTRRYRLSDDIAELDMAELECTQKIEILPGPTK